MLGVFLEPFWTFSDFRFIHSLFNGALIPVSRLDLHKSTASNRMGDILFLLSISTFFHPQHAATDLSLGLLAVLHPDLLKDLSPHA